MIERDELDQLDEVIAKNYQAEDMMIHSEASEFNIMDHSKLHLPGVSGIRKRIEQLQEQFDDIQFDIFETVIQGNKVVLHYNMSMTHTGYWNGFPPSGKELKIIGVHLLYFENEKIVKIVPLLSIIDLLKQMGSELEMTDEDIMDYLNRVKTFLQL